MSNASRRIKQSRRNQAFRYYGGFGFSRTGRFCRAWASNDQVNWTRIYLAHKPADAQESQSPRPCSGQAKDETRPASGGEDNTLRGANQ